MTVRRLSLAAAALAAALALTGCGASSGSEAETNTAAPEAPAPEGRLQLTSVLFDGGWAKAGEAGGMTGLFGTIRNDSDRDLTIEGVESRAAEHVELHEVTVDGAMREIEGDVVIPAGGEVELAPGANHIMLMGLTEPLLAGEEVEVVLRFSGGHTVDVTVPVKDYAGANEEYGGAGESGAHGEHDEHAAH